ncbi:hypothetical protein TCA2_3758 [Paenibacillus sp. TCA20]|uniref:hypothetical protein n=1 Tax=Paenibacillus sp. TCA20 TaxID=1499968 RepID=UPI0004D6D581|nr:hypothetical protein [Paenibacillus sp. TCA20]GAK41267.1 hypothetical protein TCA2_3758 [Paenibacillus sp. TCA20]
MIEHLIWIALVYGLTALCVRYVYARSQTKQQPAAIPVHYVLITCNHGLQLEWIIRGLSIDALFRGTIHKVTVMDLDSKDDTLPLLYRLGGMAGVDLSIVSASEEPMSSLSALQPSAYEEVKFVDLRNDASLTEFPFVTKH